MLKVITQAKLFPFIGYEYDNIFMDEVYSDDRPHSYYLFHITAHEFNQQQTYQTFLNDFRAAIMEVEYDVFAYSEIFTEYYLSTFPILVALTNQDDAIAFKMRTGLNVSRIQKSKYDLNLLYSLRQDENQILIDEELFTLTDGKITSTFDLDGIDMNRFMQYVPTSCYMFGGLDVQSFHR